MPATHVICPDGIEYPIQECISHCRMCETLTSGACMSRPTLASVLEERPWTGKPSTTQLLTGVREIFLKITTEYSINPQDLVFALFGSAVHSRLESIDTPDALKEERLHDEFSSGCYDFFDKRTGSLWDFKTYGSFKAAKVLGIRKNKIPIGTFKNGNTKYRTFFTEDGHKDRLDLSIQLNDYRTKLESIGTKVSNMFCEIICRDGNTQVAKGRGIFKSTYIVKLNKISNRWIDKWKELKYKAIQSALSSGKLPPPCKPRERWSYYDENKKRFVNTKCARYCVVWKSCEIGRLEHGEDVDEQ